MNHLGMSVQQSPVWICSRIFDVRSSDIFSDLSRISLRKIPVLRFTGSFSRPKSWQHRAKVPLSRCPDSRIGVGMRVRGKTKWSSNFPPSVALPACSEQKQNWSSRKNDSSRWMWISDCKLNSHVWIRVLRLEILHQEGQWVCRIPKRQLSLYKAAGKLAPNLRQVLNVLKTISASSKASACAFSTMGIMVTKLRCRLDDSSVNALCTQGHLKKKSNKKAMVNWNENPGLNLTTQYLLIYYVRLTVCAEQSNAHNLFQTFCNGISRFPTRFPPESGVSTGVSRSGKKSLSRETLVKHN